MHISRFTDQQDFSAHSLFPVGRQGEGEGNGNTNLRVCQEALEVVIAHEANTSLDGVSDDKRRTTRIEADDAFVANRSADDR